MNGQASSGQGEQQRFQGNCLRVPVSGGDPFHRKSTEVFKSQELGLFRIGSNSQDVGSPRGNQASPRFNEQVECGLGEQGRTVAGMGGEGSEVGEREEQALNWANGGQGGMERVQGASLNVGAQGGRRESRLGEVHPGSNSHIVVSGQRIVSETRLPAHYPQQTLSQIPEQSRQSLGFKSLDTLRPATQLSYAPSQKTLAYPSPAVLASDGNVYRSHVATERAQGEERRVVSPGGGQQGGNENGERSLVVNTQGQGTGNRSEKGVIGNGEASWWRDRFEELRAQFEGIRANDASKLQAAHGHIVGVQREFQLLRQAHEQLCSQYQLRVQQLGNLKKYLSENIGRGNEQLKRQLQERGMLVNLLRGENEQLRGVNGQLRTENEELRGLAAQWERQGVELQQAATILKMELQQREQQLAERRGDSVKEHSQMDRSEGGRVLQLQMQVSRLSLQLSAREQALQREFKLSTLKMGELADRYQGMIVEKEGIIRVWQERAGLLESDLNKKESLVRNLRDELVEAERRRAGALLAVPGSTTASAINPPIEREREKDKDKEHRDDSRRELDNLRKHLFDLEREKSVLGQRVEELQERLSDSEQTSQRRRGELQLLRRQLSQQEEGLAEVQQLREVLGKRAAEMAEMRELLLQKEEHSSEYEVLSKENEKLRDLTLKKNDELSELNERLYAAEKRVREQESYNPRMAGLEEQVQSLQEQLREYRSQVERLGTNLVHANECVEEAEFEVEKERHRGEELEEQLTQLRGEGEERADEVEMARQRCGAMEREMQSLASKLVLSEGVLQQQRQRALQLQEQLEAVSCELQSKVNQLSGLHGEREQLRLLKEQSQKEIDLRQSKRGEALARKNQEMNMLLSYCRQLQGASRGLQERVVRLEEEAVELRQRAGRHGECERRIEELMGKVAGYEKKILKSAHARRLFGPQTGPVFENRVIYQLKSENESLRRGLPGGSVRGDEVLSRLGEFAQNLQDAISTSTPNRQLSRVRSQQTLDSRSQLARQNMQIERLKGLAVRMQQPQEGEVGLSRNLSLQNLQDLHREELSFYKMGNKQLEDRVATLIAVNKELKEHLGRVAGRKEGEMREYYEGQLGRQRERAERVERELESARGELKRLEGHMSPRREQRSPVGFGYKGRDD